jgi:CDP-diacylglycerol--serine O-phosphatidyltransferase
MASSLFNTQDFLRILLLSLPLVVGGIIHMVVVKLDILSYLKKPIHHRLFGVNKTWRGFFVMPLATWPGVVWAQSLENLSDLSTPLLTLHPSWLLAFLLGMGYCLAELPNSFIKRRVGIKEGQTSQEYKLFFVIMDQADSALGCLVAYLILIPLSMKVFWGTIFFGTVIHLLLNVLLYLLKLRKNPL